MAACLKLDLWKERHFGTCSSSNHQDNYVISQTLIVILSRKSQLDIVGTAASVFWAGAGYHKDNMLKERISTQTLRLLTTSMALNAAAFSNDQDLYCHLYV